MASFVKYNVFAEHVAEGVHNLQSNLLKVALCSGSATGLNISTITGAGQINAGNGYTTGGIALTVSSSSQTNGLYRLVVNSPIIWTGGPSAMQPFQVAVLWNETASSPVDAVIGYWDYGSSVTLNSGETFTMSFDASSGIMTIQ